jgi:heme/copper-type cytochrome/quinol oxidase subunit 1
VITGVNLSLMGLFFSHLLPVIAGAFRASFVTRLQVALFGSGQLVACIGLFLAGGYGAPRKTPSGAASLLDGAAFGMYLNGAGALLAIIGGVMFVIMLTRVLMAGAHPADVRRSRPHADGIP